jgi:zinc protease
MMEVLMSPQKFFKYFGGVLLILSFFVSFSYALPGSPVKIQKLDNGMEIATKEDHSKNLVAMCIFVKGGSRTETPELSGLSHYYEHLIFRGGTQRQKELETRKAFQSLGEFFGYTSEDVTCYYIVSPKENFDEALWRYADAVFNLAADEKKIEKERQVILEEMHMDADRPDYQVWYLLDENAYLKHPYHRPVIGSEEVVKNANSGLLRTFYEERYVPNQMVMAVVGDFDTQEMMEKIKNAFGSYKNGKESFELGISEPGQKEFREGIKKMDCSSSNLLLGFHTPEAASADLPVLDVIKNILTQGESSRLYKALKENENLVLYINSSVSGRKDPGLYVLEAQLDPKNERKTVAIIFEELKKLREEPVTEAELEKAKTKIENSYYFDNQTYIDQAQRLCYYLANSDILLESSYLERIRNTSASDIKEVALKYLYPSNGTLALVRPKDAPEVSFKDIADRYLSLPQATSEKKSGEVKRFVLDNGLTLLLKEDHSSKTIAVEGYVKGGLLVEDEDKNGISNFVSELLLKGTKNCSSDELAKKIDSLGISLSNNCSFDYTSLSLLATQNNFDAGLKLFSEALFYPQFPEDEVEKTRKDIIAQIQRILDRSYELTNKNFAKAIFEKSPYRNSVLGEEEIIKNITKDELVNFHKKVFVPANVVLAVVGDFDTQKMKEKISSQFNGVSKALPPQLRSAKEKPQKKAILQSIPTDKTQVTFNLGYLGVAVNSPDYLPLKLAERILSSKLFFKYVYEEGMAYRMWTYLSSRIAPTPFTFEMGVSPENFEKAKDGILGEVRRLVSNPISDEELKVAKGNLLSNFYLSQQTNSQQAKTLAFYQMAGLGYEFINNYSSLVDKMTKGEVSKVARKYLDPEKYTLVVVGKVEVKE